MIASKAKKNLMKRYGVLQGMTTRDAETLDVLAAAPPVTTDHDRGVNQVLVSDAYLMDRRVAWEQLANQAGQTAGVGDEVLWLLAECPRQNAVPPDVVGHARQMCEQAADLVVLSLAKMDLIDAAKAGVSVGRWLERPS